MRQVVKERTTDYDYFISRVLNEVKKRMTEGCSVSIYKVLKNNSQELDSLVVLKEGKNFAPNIYLEPYYESYMEGTCIDEIIDRLCLVFNNNVPPTFKEDFTYSFEEMKSCITYRLVNYEKNKKLLCKVPHVKYLDLAITFHSLVRNDDEGIGTIRITNEHMRLWGKTLTDIEKLAENNTKKYFPAVIQSIDEVLRRLMTEENEDEGSYNPFGVDDVDGIIKGKVNMFILSNHKGINGASCMLYDNVLSDFANKINSDIYILPSSIHEVILVPAGNDVSRVITKPSDNIFSKDSLSRMVEEVNRTQVAAEEVLSDNVYYYSRNKDIIKL